MNCNDEASVAQGGPSAGEGETLGGGGAKVGGAAADAERGPRGRGAQDEAPPGRRRPKETWRIPTDGAASIKHLI